MFTPQDVKQIFSSGLLSFPITGFHDNGAFTPDTYAQRLEWLAPHGATALFVAGGFAGGLRAVVEAPGFSESCMIGTYTHRSGARYKETA